VLGDYLAKTARPSCASPKPRNTPT
jgi:hypothetical protein